MKVMVLVKASKDYEAGERLSPQLFTELRRYNDKLASAGLLYESWGLQRSANGFRVRFDGTEQVVTPGPFPETSELIMGFWIWTVDSIEDAITWVKKCPNLRSEPYEIEIRTLNEEKDEEYK